MMNPGPYIAIICLVALSAFFSGSEIAYAAVNELKLKRLSEAGNPRASVASEIHRNFERTLTTILIGNNLVNIAASSIAAVLFIEWLGEKGTLVSSITMTLIVLVFGEITPKIIGKTYTMKFVLIAAYPIYLLMGLLRPVIALVSVILRFTSRLWIRFKDEEPAVTEEELIYIIETIEDDGIIDKDRSDLIQSALRFSDIQVQEIFTPRADMLAIDINEAPEEILRQVLASPYTRIPVYDDSIDEIIGILHVGNFLIDYSLNQRLDVRGTLLEPVFVHKVMKLPTFFTQLNSRHLQMAIVTDEFGGTMGCVTMEDILEELVGEIWDETDVIVDEIVENADGSCLVNGDLSIRDFIDTMELDHLDIDSDYSTVGGWAIEMLEGVLHVGDEFEYENLRVRIHELDGMRVLSLKVVVLEPEPSGS